MSLNTFPLSFIKKHSSTLLLDKIPAYQAFKGNWTYHIDRAFIDAVLENEDVDISGNPLIHPVSKENFKNNIVNQLRNGTLIVNWKPASHEIPYGRVYSGRFEKGVSNGNIATMCKAIKNSYYKRLGWTDFDFKKCHPTLICEMIRLFDFPIDVTPIKHYIDNFDTLWPVLSEKYSADHNLPLGKDDIKKLFNSVIYGGGFSTWKEEIETDNPKYNYKGRPVNDIDTDLYLDFEACIKQFRLLVIRQNPALMDIISNAEKNSKKTQYEKESCFMSYYLQIFENHCLYQAYKFFVDKGWIEAKKADLCYDGFTAKVLSTAPDISIMLRDVNSHLLQTTGIAMQVTDKAFEGYIQKLVDVPMPTVSKDDGLNNNDPEYLDWKIQFETEWCKITNTASFLRIYSVNGEFKGFVFHDKKKLITAYEHLSYMKIINGKPVKTKFINEWLADSRMLSYENVGIYPPPLVAPDGVFNMWRSSPYEAIPFDENDITYDNDAVNLFLNHVMTMVNNDKIIYDWVNYFFAHSLQKPAIKPEHMITFIGLEGTGKSIMLDIFGKLYGDAKVFSTSSPERDVWGQFNSIMLHTFLLILNETDKGNSFGAEGKIKTLITEYSMTINQKGKDVIETTSYHRVIQTTNNVDPNKTSTDDRRNVIIRCYDGLKGNTEYFNKLGTTFCNKNALRSLYWYYKKLDISNWNFRLVPRTTYHKTIIEHTKDPIIEFLEAFTLKNNYKLNVSVNGKDLLKEFRQWRDDTGYKFGESFNEGSLLKKIKLSGGLPDGCVVRGKRTETGYIQVFDIELLKKYFNIGTFIQNENGIYEEV